MLLCLLYKSQLFFSPDPRSGLQLENLVQPFFPDFQVIHGGVGSLRPILSDVAYLWGESDLHQYVNIRHDASSCKKQIHSSRLKSQGKPWTWGVKRTSVVSTSFLHALRLGPPVHLCFCTNHRWPRTMFVSSYKILRPKQDTLWWTNIAIENGHRNSGFSH